MKKPGVARRGPGFVLILLGNREQKVMSRPKAEIRLLGSQKALV